MSPMVVFKYKAAPVSVNGSAILDTEQEEGSDQDDEQGKVILLKGCSDYLSHFMAYNCKSINP